MLWGAKRFAGFRDAPLVLPGHGTGQAVMGLGAPSLKRPHARVFAAAFPFAAGDKKGKEGGLALHLYFPVNGTGAIAGAARMRQGSASHEV